MCPHCSIPMRELVVGDAESAATAQVEQCTRCFGVFVEFFDGEAATVAHSLPLAEEELPEPPEDSASVCPDCSVDMVLHRYLEEGPAVLRCGQCLAMFLGYADQQAMREFAFVKDESALDWLKGLLRRIFG